MPFAWIKTIKSLNSGVFEQAGKRWRHQGEVFASSCKKFPQSQPLSSLLLLLFAENTFRICLAILDQSEANIQEDDVMIMILVIHINDIDDVDYVDDIYDIDDIDDDYVCDNSQCGVLDRKWSISQSQGSSLSKWSQMTHTYCWAFDYIGKTRQTYLLAAQAALYLPLQALR